MNASLALGARLVLNSDNKKIGRCACTYASIESTCPADCALRDAGCYARDFHVNFTVRRLDAAKRTSLQAARDEAEAIDGATHIRDLPLRLHVSGDVKGRKSAAILGEAAKRWRARRGGPVWTYTHTWRRVPRTAWGSAVSVLASVERVEQAAQATAQGYAVARVVPSLPANGRAWVEAGIRWIPCLEQTRGLKCDECRLCLDADKLRERNAGIAFGVHGTQKKRALRVIGG
jgi:hypothetical protein